MKLANLYKRFEQINVMHALILLDLNENNYLILSMSKFRKTLRLK